MRNNPKFGNKTEYGELFKKYSKSEKIRRFFVNKRQKLYKLFMLQTYHNHLTKKHARHFIEQIDNLFKTAGKMNLYFIIDEQFHMIKEDDHLPFDAFYEVLLRWCLNQDKLSYDDFMQFEEQA